MRRVSCIILQTATDFLSSGYGGIATLNKNKTPQLDLFIDESCNGVVIKGSMSWIIPSANIKVAGPIVLEPKDEKVR